LPGSFTRLHEVMIAAPATIAVSTPTLRMGQESRSAAPMSSESIELWSMSPSRLYAFRGRGAPAPRR
jgi:hypothetical protein